MKQLQKIQCSSLYGSSLHGRKTIKQAMLDLEKFWLKEIRKANKEGCGWEPSIAAGNRTYNAIDRLVKKGKIKGKYSERYWCKRGYWIVKK